MVVNVTLMLTLLIKVPTFYFGLVDTYTLQVYVFIYTQFSTKKIVLFIERERERAREKWRECVCIVSVCVSI